MTDEDKERQAALERIRERHNAYVTTFSSTAGSIVLADLERFARFSRTAVSRYPGGVPIDPYGTMYNIALQDVVKRIHQWIDWSEEASAPEED